MVCLMASHRYVIFSEIIFFTSIYCFDFFLFHPKHLHIVLVILCFHKQNHQKSSIYSHFFFNISSCMINKQIEKIYTVNIFTITIFFNCNISNIININAFVMFFLSISNKFDLKFLRLIMPL